MQGKVRKLQKEEAKIAFHTKNAMKRIQKRKLIDKQRKQMNNQLSQVQKNKEEDIRNRKQRAQQQREKVLAAGKKAVDLTLNRNARTAAMIRKIRDEDSAKEKEIVAANVAKNRSRRQELRDEFQSSKDHQLLERSVLCRQTKASRQAIMEQEKELRKERFEQRKAAVRAQKEERKGEEHTIRQRKQEREKILSKIAARDAVTISNLNDTKLKPTQQAIQQARAEYSEMLLRYKLAKQRAHRTTDKLAVLKVASKKVTARDMAGVMNAWG
jgi:hypothetical protein